MMARMTTEQKAVRHITHKLFQLFTAWDREAGADTMKTWENNQALAQEYAQKLYRWALDKYDDPNTARLQVGRIIANRDEATIYRVCA